MDNWQAIHPLIDRFLLPYLLSVFIASLTVKVLPPPGEITSRWYGIVYGMLNRWAMNPALQILGTTTVKTTSEALVRTETKTTAPATEKEVAAVVAAAKEPDKP